MALTGRQHEIAALTVELDALKHGRGRALVLVGDGGSGKTALAEEFGSLARTSSVRVLWMGCRAMDDGEAWWPWPAIVRQLDGGEELVERLRADDRDARVFDDITALLVSNAERQPLAIVFDDGDLLGANARDLLAFVAEQLRFQPLVLLVTAGDQRRVERIGRAGTTLVLQGLDANAVRELLVSEGVGLDDGLTTAVTRLTGGLPGEIKVLGGELSTRDINEVDDVFRVALDLAVAAERTQGRAASGTLVQRLIAARDLASPSMCGDLAMLVHRLGGTTSATGDDRVALLEESLAAMTDDDDIALRARLHGALARELYHGDALRDDRDPHAEASTAWTLAQQSGDAPTLAFCLWARHDIEWRPGTGARRLELLDELVMLLGRTSRYEEMADALLARFAIYLELGDARVDREFDRFLSVAERDPTPRLRHLVLSRRAMRELMGGNLERADELINEAARSARASGEPDGSVVALNQRCELYAERGDRSPLLPTLERFRAVSSHPAIVASLALARLDAGDRDGARTAVSPYANAALDNLQPEYGRAWVLSMLAEVFISLGDRDAIRNTARALTPFAGTNIVVGGGVLYHGAVDFHLGVLCVAAADVDAAVPYLRSAIEMHQRVGASRWTQRTEHALRSLADHAPTNSMMRDDDVWTISYAKQIVRCKDAKGLRDLATLLANPGVEVRATVLAGTPDDENVGVEMLDRRARDEIAAHLRDLDADIARADDRGDQAASARAGAERDALLDELRAATGLGGRSRRVGDAGERARKAVSARLHDTLGRIEQLHPELGRHLRDSVVTGRSCCYQPDPATQWVVRQNESGI